MLSVFCCGVYSDAFSSCRFVFTDFTGEQIRHFFTDYIITAVDSTVVDSVGDLIEEQGKLVCRESTKVVTLHT